MYLCTLRINSPLKELFDNNPENPYFDRLSRLGVDRKQEAEPTFPDNENTAINQKDREGITASEKNNLKTYLD
jgi:hypothetical protein